MADGAQKVAFDFTPKRYHQEMKALIQAGADSHPWCTGRTPRSKRRLRIWKNHLGNLERFQQYNQKPEGISHVP